MKAYPNAQILGVHQMVAVFTMAMNIKVILVMSRRNES
ncbi:hypothetical protein MIZ03_3037 [Rhodoferax lithotrophicus]|uniref:Transposase DDE domain-containing protein n=1 Tax=Rhodoferax lithotrophicus TaxID=2798804 RepID=A0ABM7MP99_9BURK|nr:hypothetical protein MIZ03_3037 [Rhodoferax sp. MIZ03]